MFRTRRRPSCSTVLALAAAIALTSRAAAQPGTTVLGGKRVRLPVTGVASIEYTQPIISRDGDFVITRVRVKNLSDAPIKGLTVIENWFDRSSALLISSSERLPVLLGPDIVRLLEIRTRFNPRMTNHSLVFRHDNGKINATMVTALKRSGARSSPRVPNVEPQR
jgi:hypothetical protein